MKTEVRVAVKTEVRVGVKMEVGVGGCEDGGEDGCEGFEGDLNGAKDGDGFNTGGHIGGSGVAIAEEGTEADADGESSRRRGVSLRAVLDPGPFSSHGGSPDSV